METSVDEPQNTGNDQTQTESGEDQNQPSVEELRAQLAAKDEELKNTNAYITRMQQQQQQPEPEETDDSPAVDESQVPQEQRELIRRLAGADKLQEEIASLKKERENEQQQAQQRELENSFKSISSEYKDAGVPLPTSIAEKQALIEYMNETRIFNPEVAFKHKHASRLEEAKTKQAAKSDKGDTEAVTRQNAYRDALQKVKKDAAARGQQVSSEELAQVEAQFKGDPTTPQG